MPCCIKECDRAGKYAVTGGAGTIHMCATHALEVMELAKQNKLPETYDVKGMDDGR